MRPARAIRDAKGQPLAYVYFEDETGRRSAMGRLTRDDGAEEGYGAEARGAVTPVSALLAMQEPIAASVVQAI
jgi:hypothetical protein